MLHICTNHLMLLAVTADQYHVQIQGVCRLQPVISCCITRYISCTSAAWTKSSPKHVQRPKASDVAPEWSRAETWTCSNTSRSSSVQDVFHPTAVDQGTRPL